MALVERKEWIEFLSVHLDAHLLQTTAWGEFKGGHGWYPRYLINGTVGAQILFRRLPFNRTIAYIPKGPIGNGWKNFLAEADKACRQEKAILIYVEPDDWEGAQSCSLLEAEGFVTSPISIQPRRTITLSLTGDESVWMKRMKQKTRYNIRLAEKKDVRVELSEDVSAFTDLMLVTGSRDNFGIHESTYYHDVYAGFAPGKQCALLLAKYEEQVLAGIMLFARGNRAWYFYGASNNKERNRMPTYLLQWEGMKWAAARGCTEYDLWGIPDVDEDELETQFTIRSDGLWGVYRFKRGFGGEIKRTAGVYQKILNRPLFAIYNLAMKIRKSYVS